jgi:integrase
MKKGENYNHPEKGDLIRVDPIKGLRDIKAIKKLLADKPRDYALFVIGINTNLRASDLLQLTAGQVRHLKVDGEILLREKKTQKVRRINLNKSCIEAIQDLLRSRDFKDDDPLFYSSRGKVLTGPAVTSLVKEWCAAINLRGNYGSHTLRKTWGYHQRVTFGRGVAELMECFNHSNQRQTLDYLCIQPEEIKSIYRNEL